MRPRGNQLDFEGIYLPLTVLQQCGPSILFFPGLSRSPTPRQLERALDELNAGRPQCPVGLHTLIVPRKNSQNIAPEAQPMVYLKCGHVQVCTKFT